MKHAGREHTFRDEGGDAVVELDVSDVEQGSVDVQATGDSLSVSAKASAAADPTVIWSVTQLYGTVEAAATAWKITDQKHLTVRLKKLDPSAAWPQLEAAAEQDNQHAAQPASENPLEERENVKALLTAAQDGNLEGFKAAATKFGGNDLGSVRDGNGRDALHFAAAAGHADLCRYLIKDAHFSVDSCDDAGETALSLAAGSGQLSCMQALLDAGASATLSRDGAAQPMHRAASSGSVPCLELLLEKGASANAASRMGTPLFWALGSNEEACAAFLLDHGADPGAPDDANVTPVLLAAAIGNEKLLKKLIGMGVNVIAAADGGPSPLHVAVDGGSESVVKALLKAGADPDAVDGSSGCRPVDLAASAKNRGLVELLLPLTTPAPGQVWTVDALLRDAKPLRHEHCGGCCGQDHEHDHAPAPSFTAAEVPDAEDPDKEKAQLVKRSGDEAFVEGQFQAAVDRYSEALRHDTGDAKLWANRSAAHLRTGAHEDALQDARRARTLDSKYAKAFYREGSAAEALKLWEDAAQAYFESCRLDPNTAAYAQAFHNVVQEARKAAA